MAPDSPIVARWEMLYRVRRKREQAGLSAPAMGKAVGFSTGYWPQVEREKRILPEERLAAVLEFLDFDEAEKSELIELRTIAKQPAWWDEYSSLSTESERWLWGLEYGAEEISAFESMLIPGLLQTEEYARTLISSDTAFIRQIEVNQRIAARMRRQERLTGSDVLRFNVVVSECALVQETGGRDVLHQQLLRIITEIEENPDTLDFRVLPFTSRSGALFGGTTYYLFDFDRPQMPTLAWCENPAFGQVLEDPGRVRDLATSFGYVQSQSLSKSESFARIKHYAGELG